MIEDLKGLSTFEIQNVTSFIELIINISPNLKQEKVISNIYAKKEETIFVLFPTIRFFLNTRHILKIRPFLYFAGVENLSFYDCNLHHTVNVHEVCYALFALSGGNENALKHQMLDVRPKKEEKRDPVEFLRKTFFPRTRKKKVPKKSNFFFHGEKSLGEDIIIPMQHENGMFKRQLKKLNFGNTILEIKNFPLLLNSISGVRSLEHLNISKNCFKDCFQIVTHFFKRNASNIKELRLDELQLSISDLKELSTILKTNKTITTLGLGKIRKLTKKRMNVLVPFLEFNNTLRVLDLRVCYIHEESLKPLFYQLKKNRGVKWLLLGGNKIDFDDGEQLHNLFEYNKTLEVLDLACCNLARSGEYILQIFEDFPETKLSMINFYATGIKKKWRRRVEEYLDNDESVIRSRITFHYPNYFQNLEIEIK